MHDIRAIRDNPQAFDTAMARRGLEGASGPVLARDAARRARINAAETAQAEQNRASKEVGAAKTRGDEGEFARLRALVGEKKAEVAAMQAEAKDLDAQLTKMLMGLPNLPDEDVPDGADENANVELRRWGTPAVFDFTPKEHYEIAGVVPGMDFEAAATLSGSRFVVLKGAVARVHRALAQFMLDVHVDENGLSETWTPVLVQGQSIEDAGIGKTPLGGTGQLPKFREDLYFVGTERGREEHFNTIIDQHLELPDFKYEEFNKESLKKAFIEAFKEAPTSEEYWLIPTAEVTLTNLVNGRTVDAATLPRRMVAHTQCFRSEAGSAGRDTAGMLRQHQFEKVEMVSITHPETSRAELERMTDCAEGILRRLGLPYRTVVLCTGDMGFGARRTHDIEVWLPGQNMYREISSVSVCGDFQARRMNARFRPDSGGKPDFVHTLNGSGLAVGRALIAVLENGQRADGSVRLPEVLHPYLRGHTVLGADGVLG